MYKFLENKLIQLLLIAILIIAGLYNQFSNEAIVNVDKNQSIETINQLPKTRLQLKGHVRLSDGDSLKFNQSSRRARLFGIDSPELAQKCTLKGKEWPCGVRAKDAFSKKIAGKKLICTGDEEDKHQRLIATCYLPQKDGTFENMNAWMVRNGWAIAYRHYSKKYVSEEARAKKQKLGIWQGKFLDPYQWRKQNRR